METQLATENVPALAGQLAHRALSEHVNFGAVEIESQRAIAEAQGQLILAKKFPRSMAAATAEFMDACKSPEFAATAFYSVPNRGSGPSIRFAEEVARVYGNFQYGHRELSRSESKSEVEVFAWDMQQNNRSTRQLTVNHVLDTQRGPKKLTDQTDIDNKIANVASKQMRGRILALVPKHLVAMGIAECKKTLAGNNDVPMSTRVNKMTVSFAKYGINADHLAKYIGHSLDDITADELVDLIGVFNALKDGAKPGEYFSAPAVVDALPGTVASAGDVKPAIAPTEKASTRKARGAAKETPAAETTATVTTSTEETNAAASESTSAPTQESVFSESDAAAATTETVATDNSNIEDVF